MSTSTLNLRRCAMIAGVLWGMTTTPLAAATLYVAPDGNDAWSGKLQHTNAAAHRRAAGHVGRGQKRRPTAEGPRTVDRGRCTYTWPRARIRLAETLVFEPQDSGTAEAPIVYQADDGARPVFTGGRTDPRLRPGRRRPVEGPSARGPGRQVVFRGPVRQRSPRNPRPRAQRVLLLCSRQGRRDATASVRGRPEGHCIAGGAAQGSLERRYCRGLFLLGELRIARGFRRSADRHGRTDRRRSVAVRPGKSRSHGATTSRTSRPRWTRPANGSWIAMAICSTFPCPAKIRRRRKLLRRCSTT